MSAWVHHILDLNAIIVIITALETLLTQLLIAIVIVAVYNNVTYVVDQSHMGNSLNSHVKKPTSVHMKKIT